MQSIGQPWSSLGSCLPNPSYPNQSDEEWWQSSALEDRVIYLVNIERAQRNLGPLLSYPRLARVARIKAEDMDRNNVLSHNSPTFGSPFDMLRSFGIRFSLAAENIARGQRTAEAVVSAWMNSPGHRANILNSYLRYIGVGYSNTRGNPFWAQMFITP